MPQVFSYAIPPGSSFEVKGTTSAGAGQRFDLFVPAHRQVVGFGEAASPTTTTFTGGGPPYAPPKPMSPTSFQDTTLDLLPLTIAFYWWNGQRQQWIAASDFRMKRETGSEVIVGFNDNIVRPGGNYTNQVITIQWTPAASLLSPGFTKELEQKGGIANADALLRIANLEERLRIVESMVASNFTQNLEFENQE